MCLRRSRSMLLVMLLVSLVLLATLTSLVVSVREASNTHPSGAGGQSSAVPACALVKSDAFGAGDASTEHFLVYAPQFGLSNQVVALRNAVVWALLLNRTLVLPHLLGHGTAEVLSPHGTAFDVPRASSLVAERLRIVEMPAFLTLGLDPALVLALDVDIRMRRSDDYAYYRALGVGWASSASSPPFALRRRVPMRDFTPASIIGSFGSCRGAPHRVLAFSSLFAAVTLKGPADYPGGARGYRWLNQVAMPALLQPTPAVSALVDRIHEGLVPGCAARRGACPYACVHIRQGDFREECAKYDVELASISPRPWVRSFARLGYSCMQDERTLVTNLRALQARMPRGERTPIFASIENTTFLQREALRPFNLSSLASHGDAIRAAVSHASPDSVQLPAAGIREVLLDQLVCARAESLLVNAFSTFSQLVMGRIGMSRPEVGIGWTRNLSAVQQKQLGVTVGFWLTDHWKRLGYV